MQGNETNLDVLQSALTQLECTANKGLCTVKYDLPGEKLHIIKTAVEDSRIMTDVENGIIEWLGRIIQTHPPGTLWRYDYHERHVLFSKHIYQALDQGKISSRSSEEVRALIEQLDYDENVRKRFNWLKNQDPRRVQRGGNARVCGHGGGRQRRPYNGMLDYAPGDALVQRRANKGGRAGAGAREKRVVMPGSMRISLNFRRRTSTPQTRPAYWQRPARSSRTSSMHAAGGLAGQRIFRVLARTDHEISSARTSTVGAPSKQQIRYKNPRIMAKSTSTTQASSSTTTGSTARTPSTSR